MFEATTNQAARNAIQTAHAERGRAVAKIWSWLFSTTSH